MSKNLRVTLSELDLSLNDKLCATDPYNIPWWCWWGCVGLGCHGAGNSVNNCPMGDCSSTACNNNSMDWNQPGDCLDSTCDCWTINSTQCQLG
jgi:hypothetical protein